MKIDTLNFLTVLLNSHAPSVLHPHLGSIIPAVVTAVDDSFYRITSEALLVLNCIVKTTRPSEVECIRERRGARSNAQERVCGGGREKYREFEGFNVSLCACLVLNVTAPIH